MGAARHRHVDGRVEGISSAEAAWAATTRRVWSMDETTVATLIEEAAKKSGLVWVRGGGSGRRSQAVWHLWQNGAVYVLTGGLEQPAPAGLDDHAYVTVRSKDKWSRLVTFVAEVGVVEPDDDEWQAVVPALLGKRLNLPDGDAAPLRWARECTLFRLTPTGDVVETPDDRSSVSHAATPPPTPARTRVPRPLHVRGRPSRPPAR